MKPWQPCAGALAVYAAIEQGHSLDGKSPSMNAIRTMTGLRSKNTVWYHIQELKRNGWLKADPELAGKRNALVPIHYPRVYYRRREQE